MDREFLKTQVFLAGKRPSDSALRWFVRGRMLARDVGEADMTNGNLLATVFYDGNLTGESALATAAEELGMQPERLRFLGAFTLDRALALIKDSPPDPSDLPL